jgi:hypothetical protein
MKSVGYSVEVATMNMKALLVLVLIVLLLGCATPQQCKDLAGAGTGQPPVILDSHAARVIRPGGTWRVYLHAKDKDEDMKDIAAIINQTGVGLYPTSFTPVKAEDSKEVTGYLFLNTSARERNLINDRLTLKLMVRDCAGNKSKPVEFPLRFDYGPAEKTPAKWKETANRRLGAIMIDIESSLPSRTFFGL